MSDTVTVATDFVRADTGIMPATTWVGRAGKAAAAACSDRQYTS